MNPEEQVVTWLISLGALNSPKMMIGDPVQFLKTSLKDGVVLCKLLLRLLPGSIEKVRGEGALQIQITTLFFSQSHAGPIEKSRPWQCLCYQISWLRGRVA